jgi:hemerythrin superfamily protein
VDALEALRADHREVARLFEQMDESRKTKQRGSLAAQIVESLALHRAVEEQLFYPIVQEATRAKGLVWKLKEQHRVIGWMADQLKDATPEDEAFAARVSVLRELVGAHATAEEDSLFPLARQALGEDSLQQLGDRVAEGKFALRDPKQYRNI